MTHDLSRLLHPRHVAVFGGKWAGNVVSQCRRMGFEGPVWPVHPNRETLGGLPCYRTVEDLPQPPDACFIGVNRHQTVELVQALAARGAGGAVCFASGFAEAEDGREAGAALQARLVEAAGAMPVLGPNCYGLINYLDGALLWPDQHGGRRVERGVAIVGQSSNVLINLTMQQRGLPLAHVIAAGNQAQTGLAEIAIGLIADPRVTAIGLHVEGARDLASFQTLAAAARAAGKPVVALKVGRSAAAQAATISHTASIAGGDRPGRAVLKRLGFAVVETLPEFLETLKLLHFAGPLKGRSLVAVCCSGGEASLIGDLAEGRRVDFPAFPAARRQAISATLGPLVTIANPLDYHTFIWGDGAAMARTFSAITAAAADLTLFVLDFPRKDRCDEADWHVAIEAMVEAASGAGPVAVAASLPENMPERWADALAERGLIPLSGLAEALAAAEAAADIGAAWANPAPEPLLAAPMRAIGEPAVLAEHDARTALAAHGLTFPDARTVETPDDAARAAQTMGFPVVLKGLGFAHKTEAGAVHLGLASPGAVRTAAAGMKGAQGYLVERQIEGAVAELLIGVLRDPVYGFQLTIGAGGILAELMEDTVLLPIPATGTEIRQALGGLRIGPVLSGYRNRPAADIDAIVGAANALQSFAQAEAHRLIELDINPLLATPDGAIAVDALIRVAPG